MTKKRDYFSGIQEVMLRSTIKLADYNPRKISTQAKQMLRRSIKKYGVVGGITVNRRTGNIVGGNQKIAILDEIYGYPANDYEVRAEVVDYDLATEKSLCLMLNSQNAQGEWDDDKLREMLPDINWQDAGLTEEDLSLIGVEFLEKTEGENILAQELDDLMRPSTKEEQSAQRQKIETAQNIAKTQAENDYQSKKEHMESVKQQVNTKAAEKALEAEAYVMLSFDNVEAKQRFLRKYGFVETDKVIKGEVLIKALR